MSPLRQRMIDDLRVRNYSPRTIQQYVSQVAAFARYFKKSPDQLGPAHIRGFQVHLIERGLSWSSFNIAVSALRFFYRVTLKKDWMIEHLPYGKKPKRLPVILGREEVVRLLGAIPDLNYRIMLMTAYSAGLRVSEVARLRVEDIDRQRMLIRVREGKGRKDRYVPLSTTLVEVLSGYAPRSASPATGSSPASAMGTTSVLAQWAECAAVRFRRPASASRSRCIPCGIALPPICSNRASTSAQFRNSWDTTDWRRRRFTRTLPRPRFAQRPAPWISWPSMP